MNRITFLAPRGNLVSVTAAGQGPPLFLLHGFPLDHRQWRPQLDALSHHYRILAPDLRGFGQSSLNEGPYSMRDLADDVEQVRQHFAADQPIALCGLSMGGYVAFEYWRRYGANLSALILSNTKPTADTEAARAARRKMADVALQLGSWEAVADMLPKLLSPAHLEQRGQPYQATLQMLQACTAEAVAMAQQAMENREDFLASLPNLQTPTLVITGQHDELAPPDSTRKWAAILPNCQCQVIAEAAHLTPLEAPGEFNRLVHEFLRTW